MNPDQDAADLWSGSETLLAEPDDLSAGEPAESAPQLYYRTLDRWVAEFLAPTYRRPISDRGLRWCPQWWRHTEALVRLEALWRAFEHLRLDPATGVSVWFRDHADPHMRVLLDPDHGPFKYCTVDGGHKGRLEPLPLQEPPAGFFQPPTA